MRVPPALMWWEVRTVSTVPATLDTLEMVSPVWVSIAVYSNSAIAVLQLIEVLLEILWMITPSISTHAICDCYNSDCMCICLYYDYTMQYCILPD